MRKQRTNIRDNKFPSRQLLRQQGSHVNRFRMHLFQENRTVFSKVNIYINQTTKLGNKELALDVFYKNDQGFTHSIYMYIYLPPQNHKQHPLPPNIPTTPKRAANPT